MGLHLIMATESDKVMLVREVYFDLEETVISYDDKLG